MHILHLSLLSLLLSIFGPDAALEHSSAPVLESSTDAAAGTTTSTILQSKDGGETWQDISTSLPENEPPHGFFAGETDIYLRMHDVMYRSSSNLKTPVWEKQYLPDNENMSISFNPSGVMAYNFEGKIYRKMPSSETWSPIYTQSTNLLETVFEAANGSVFLGTQRGLYKSINKGHGWKQVLNEGWVSNIVESQGVLIGAGQKGIMRSADNGEHWEWVISEGGVGIAVERIDGGFAVISYNEQTKSRRVRISMDGGKNWKDIDQQLRPSLSITSIKQMGPYLLCGHPDGIFRSADKGRTWQLVHGPVEPPQFKIISVVNTTNIDQGKKVFTIYASGKTLYAVGNNAGC